MLVRITAGTGVGHVQDLVPAVARARIAGGTAVALDPEARPAETTALEPRQERAVTAAQNAPPRRPDPAAAKRRR